METGRELEYANQRLLERRAELKATACHTQSIESISDIIPRVKYAQEISCRTFPADEPDNQDKHGDPDWTGKQNGVSRLYAGCTFETFTGNGKLIAGIRELSQQADRHMLIMGKTGCGKTHLAVSILKESGPGWFVTAPDLLLAIRSSFNGGNVTEDQIIQRYANYRLLIIDDLGAEKTTEYSITTLYIIIDRRIRDMKKTVITTNLTQEQIEETFGARIASRLSGMENIKINMPDYRKKR